MITTPIVHGIRFEPQIGGIRAIVDVSPVDPHDAIVRRSVNVVEKIDGGRRFVRTVYQVAPGDVIHFGTQPGNGLTVFVYDTDAAGYMSEDSDEYVIIVPRTL